MSKLWIIIEEIEKRIREGENNGCSVERIAELKSLLSFVKSLQIVSDIVNESLLEKAWSWVEDNVLTPNQQEMSEQLYKKMKEDIL